jgi:hypothetical protein
MLEKVLRDEATMPLITQMLAGYRAYLEAAKETLMGGWRVRGRSHTYLRAAHGHALAFATWRSLTREQGLDDSQAAELMCRLATDVARSCDAGQPQPCMLG